MRCILVLDNLRSIENTASIFRTAECLGVKKMILVGTTPAPIDRFGRKLSDFTKVALGAEDLVEWEYIKTEDLTFKLQDLKEGGYKIIALEQDSKSNELKSQGDAKTVLIVGNEVEGITRGVLVMCDEVLEIPMRGKKESLNVSVAAGIALYELLK